MESFFEQLCFDSKREGDVIDISSLVESVVKKSGVSEGLVCVSCIGSTGSVTTMEFEPGLCEDFPRFLEKFAPREEQYLHHEMWHDDNGRSHVKASLLGPGIVLPIHESKIVVGVWQQIVFVELDTHPRSRRVAVQVLGMV